MAEENKEDETLKSILKVILLIFVVTYILWYINGGPEKWNKKMKLEKLSNNNSII